MKIGKKAEVTSATRWYAIWPDPDQDQGGPTVVKMAISKSSSSANIHMIKILTTNYDTPRHS